MATRREDLWVFVAFVLMGATLGLLYARLYG